MNLHVMVLIPFTLSSGFWKQLEPVPGVPEHGSIRKREDCVLSWAGNYWTRLAGCCPRRKVLDVTMHEV